MQVVKLFYEWRRKVEETFYVLQKLGFYLKILSTRNGVSEEEQL